MTNKSFNYHLMSATILVSISTIINSVALIIGSKLILSTVALVVVIVGLAYTFVIIYRARMAGLV